MPVAQQSQSSPVRPDAPPTPEVPARTWAQILGPYKKPHLGKSLFQLITTLGLFVGAWALMVWSLEISYWLTLGLAVLASGFLTRLFIFQHDCGHGAFFRSTKLNHAVGFVLGVLTLTPYRYWRRTHAIHHAHSGDLDHRDFGEIDTLTVREYLDLSRWGRTYYRIYRAMPTLLIIGPIWQFLLKHRLPSNAKKEWKKEWASILWTNVALVAVVVALGLTVGWRELLLVHGPILMISGALGIWLFYIQHQFQDTYWEHNDRWSYYRAGLEGSSFYDLPRVLHWFTGNIGYHHVHHLSSRIPNYLLRKCYEENPELHQVTKLTLWESFKCARLKLWDEESRRLISFGELRRMLRSGQLQGA